MPRGRAQRSPDHGGSAGTSEKEGQDPVAARSRGLGCQRAHVPLARQALEGVAADEARHAELAWSFVAWLLTLSRAQSAQVRRDAWASVIEPCWAALQVRVGVETPAGAGSARA